MKADSSATSTLEVCAESAQWAEQRELEEGRPVPNCPTATEIRRAVETLREIFTTDNLPAQRAAYLQRELAEISDKWLDPESDPIGVRLRPLLEQVIEGLNQELERAFPESAETFRKWASLRVTKQAVQRAVYLRSQNPSPLSRIWAKVPLRRSKSESESG